MPKLKSVRLLIQTESAVRHIARISLGQKDASLYLISPHRRSLAVLGRKAFPGDEISVDVALTEQSEVPHAPKLSIHQSGQVHVEAGTDRTVPMMIPSLADLRGEHVASVTADRFDALPVFEGTPKTSGREQDHLIPSEPEVESGRLAIYINGREPTFTDVCRLRFEMSRGTLTTPLYVGIAPFPQQPLASEGPYGVTVIGGWNPQTEHPEDFLFVRTTPLE